MAGMERAAEPVDEIDLQQVDSNQKQALTMLISGVDPQRAAPEAPLDLPGAAVSVLQIHRDPAGGVEGWLLAHLAEATGPDGPQGLLRLETGRRPGSDPDFYATEAFVLRRLEAWKQRQPGHSLALLCLCGDAAHYSLLARSLPQLLPHWKAPTDPDQAGWMGAMADRMGLPPATGADPLLRPLPADRKPAPAAQRYWSRVDSPSAHFFQARVPPGQGVVVLAPLPDLAPGRCLARLGGWLMGGLGALPAPAPRPRGRLRPLDPTTAEDQLRAVPLLKDLAPAVRARLAQEAQRVQIADQQVVVRIGQPAEGLYVVTTGRLQVLLPDPQDPEQEREVDSLSDGDVFGEIGLVMGGSCTATVRAQSPVELLRIGRETIAQVVRQHPDLSEALWKAAGRRLLTNRLLDESGAEEAALAAATRAAAASGLLLFQEAEPLLAGHYFVVHGSGRVMTGQGWFTVEPGALFKLAGPGSLCPRGEPVRLLAWPPTASFDADLARNVQRSALSPHNPGAPMPNSPRTADTISSAAQLADDLRLQVWLAQAEQKNPSLHQRVSALSQARDDLRLQLHLGKMEASDAWETLEGHWTTLRSRLDQALDDAPEGPIKDILDEIRDGYHHFRDNKA